MAALYVDKLGPYVKMARDLAQTIRRNCPTGDDDWNAATAANFTNAFGIDCWTIERDARRYAGPYPVVAHPPAHDWKVWCDKRSDPKIVPGCAWKGTRADLRSNGACPSCFDHTIASGFDCAVRAVEQVRTFGGVLEHPARSKLWRYAFGREDFLPQPCADHPAGCASHSDRFGGVTIEVNQEEWGGSGSKLSWVYIVGTPLKQIEEIVGSPPFPGRKSTSHRANTRTARLLAERLVLLARLADKSAAARVG